MTAPTCVVCTRPTADGYACAHCASRAAEQLAQICDMTPAARDVAHRVGRRSGGQNGSGKPGSTLPLDLAATARLDAVQSALLSWARHISETRGVVLP